VRQRVSQVVFGLQVTAFGLACLAASPMLLFKAGVDWLRDSLEARWPDRQRAEAISFWIGMLPPVILCVILATLLASVIA
jgi:hypothetical protein